MTIYRQRRWNILHHDSCSICDLNRYYLQLNISGQGYQECWHISLNFHIPLVLASLFPPIHLFFLGGGWIDLPRNGWLWINTKNHEIPNSKKVTEISEFSLEFEVLMKNQNNNFHGNLIFYSFQPTRKAVDNYFSRKILL